MLSTLALCMVAVKEDFSERFFGLKHGAVCGNTDCLRQSRNNRQDSGGPTRPVGFNGAAATFTVVSRSLIKATVPAGATGGFVTVTTLTGTPRATGNSWSSRSSNARNTKPLAWGRLLCCEGFC